MPDNEVTMAQVEALMADYVNSSKAMAVSPSKMVGHNVGQGHPYIEGPVVRLCRSWLTMHSRLQKLEAVAEAAREAPDWMLMPGAAIEEQAKGRALKKALSALSPKEDPK